MAKLGLVLSGGGAKGAYHVGVIKALQEVGIQIDMISGASIGALNAAVLLSAENQQQGLNHLEQLWDKLPSIKPIQFKGMEDITDFLFIVVIFHDLILPMDNIFWSNFI